MRTIKIFIHRATMTLLAMVLTLASAWAKAGTVNVEFQTLVADEWKTRTVNATVLTGDEETLPWGYYVVNSDIHFNHGVQFSGNVYIILADGCTMTMGTTQNRIGNFGLYGSAGTASDNYGSDYELYIYGQSQQSGRLEIYSSTTKSNVSCIKVKELFVFGGNILLNGYNGINTSSAGQGTFIYNGNVSFSSLREYGKGIDCDRFYMSGGSLNFYGLAQKAIYSKNFTMSGGSITVNDAGEIISKDWANGTFSMTGGSLSVNGLGKEINARTITLGLTKDGDQIKAGNYAGTVTVETGKKLMDNNDHVALYYGTLSDEQKTAIKGKTLVPAKFDGTGTELDPYVIHTAKGWDTFCEMFGTDAAPNDFNNVYVKLGNDISVTTMAGTSSHPFKGHFDGDGHTLTVDYHVDNENFIAPFRYVVGATIENLNIEGTIYASAMKAGGLIGDGAFNTTTITNCRVSAIITGGNETGGFISTGKVEIDHCMFNGKFENSYLHGGFIGYNNSSDSRIANSLFDPQPGSVYTNTFYCGTPAPTITNCYYSTKANADLQAKLAHTITADASANMTLTGTPGVQFGSTVYAKCGHTNGVSDETISLTLADPGTAPDGYGTTGSYGATAGHLAPGDGTSYTLDMPAENIDVVISAFAPIPYSITYNLNGGSWGGIVPPENYTIESDDVLLPAPTKAGCSFMGWYNNKGLTGDPVSCIPVGSYGDKEFWAKWEAIRTKKSLTACTAEVPNQTKGTYDYIYYKFDAANNPANGIEIGETVTDVTTTPSTNLILGTDYKFNNVIYADGRDGMPEHVGDKCLVEIIGIGNYDGTLYVPFTIIGPEVSNQTWGDLTWSLSNGALNIRLTTPANGNKPMPEAGSKENYPWYPFASYITSVTIQEDEVIEGENTVKKGITSIGAYAFQGTNGLQATNPNQHIATVSLPSTLTSIGEDAFAYCIGATITIPASVTSIGEGAFMEVLKVKSSLYDNADNTGMISLLAEAKKNDLTLQGRTLWKDGNWNTLCLPFDMTSEQVTAQLAPDALKELDVEGYYNVTTGYPWPGNTGYDGYRQTGFDATSGKLYLYFKDATSIEAGKPYIIKWTKPNDYVAYTGHNANACSDLVNPKFTDVKVWSYNPATKAVTSADDYVTFLGIYSPTDIYTAGKTNLYLGTSTDNNGTPDDDTDDTTVSTLYYPWGDAMTSFNVNAFRAYFQLNNGLTAGTPTNSNVHSVKSFKLNIDDDDTTTAITSLAPTGRFGEGPEADAWYTLDGRKVVTSSNRPMSRGLYIHNGKKIVIK
jgi:uncharacterized repeat protein (TIGR02543 family)